MKKNKKPRNRLKLRRFLFTLLKGFIIFCTFLLPIQLFWRFVIVLLLLYLFHLFSHRPFYKKNDTIVMFFGPPGCGKTTFAAYLSHLAHLRGDKVASNCEITGNYILDPANDLGVYSLYNDGKGTVTIIDEASIDYDGRNFKSLPDQNKRFFALHRHECCPVYVFSQAVDCDKRIRDRAACCYMIQRSLIPGCLSYRKIKKSVIIDENHQLLDGFDFVPFSRHILYKRPYYKMFDTLDRSMCPKREKQWKKWGEQKAPSIPIPIPKKESEIKNESKAQ